MGVVNSGFGERPRASDPRLPPGQTLAEDWPVLTAGPTPDLDEHEWSFTITTEGGTEQRSRPRAWVLRSLHSRYACSGQDTRVCTSESIIETAAES